MIGYFRPFIEAVDYAHNDERHKHNRQLESPKKAQRAPPREEIRKICMILADFILLVVRGIYRIDMQKKHRLAQPLL